MLAKFIDMKALYIVKTLERGFVISEVICVISG